MPTPKRLLDAELALFKQEFQRQDVVWQAAFVKAMRGGDRSEAEGLAKEIPGLRVKATRGALQIKYRVPLRRLEEIHEEVQRQGQARKSGRGTSKNRALKGIVGGGR